MKNKGIDSQRVYKQPSQSCFSNSEISSESFYNHRKTASITKVNLVALNGAKRPIWLFQDGAWNAPLGANAETSHFCLKGVWD